MPEPVLLISQSLDLGGSERQLTQIARSLDRRLFTPHVGCFRQGGVREKDLRAAGVPLVEFPVTSFRNWSAISAGRKLRRYIHDHNIHLVHAFDTPATLFVTLWGRAKRITTVLTSQRAHRSLSQPGHWRLLRIADRRTHGIVVNCEFLRQHLMADEKVPPERIHVCYNGVDLDEFQPAPADSAGSARPGPISASGPVIGAVCAIRPEKDLGTLLRAFDSLAGSNPTLRLVIVGHGPSSEQVQVLAAQLQNSARVHIERGVGRVTDWLHALDIFVLPSLSEGFSNSLLEAMACGCAVVASSVGGNPEIVGVDQTRGLLFPARDASALEQALRTLLDDHKLRSSLAAAGTAFVRNTFSLDASARRMQDIYTVALCSRG